MSKFYTYAEVRAGTPTVTTVSAVRDELFDYLRSNVNPAHAVIYGSTIWSLHREFEDQHTSRSDVDVALSAVRDGLYEAGVPAWSFKDERAFMTLCRELSGRTRVPIELTSIGKRESYRGLLNPSTADHFRLLSQGFPELGYGSFKKQLRVVFHDRLTDLEDYSRMTKRSVARLTSKDRPVDWSDPANLAILSTLENVPDHLIRKILGLGKELPCPDSKKVVRGVFASGNTPIENNLRLLFVGVYDVSAAYESLISEGARLTEGRYLEQLGNIASSITGSVREALRVLDQWLVRLNASRYNET